MKSILQLKNLLIEQIVSGKETPNPKIGVLWVFFPKSRHPQHNIANKKSIWVGLKTSELAESPSLNETTILFEQGTANISSKINPSKDWINIDLTDHSNYRLSERHCQVQLKVPCPEALIYPKACQNLVNNTVWVDPVYGNDRTGQVENKCFPFQTINAALQAIPSSELEFGKVGWLVNLAPGRYTEVVTLPSNVYLKGSGFDQTVLDQLRIIGYGASSVSDLAISGSALPLLSVSYTDSNVPINQPINLSNLRLNSTPVGNLANRSVNVITLTQAQGSRGNINFKSVNTDLNLSLSAFDATQFTVLFASDLTPSANVNFEVKLNECFFQNLGPLSSINSSFLNIVTSSTTRLFIEGGLYGLTSEAFPNFSQIIISGFNSFVTQTNSNIRVEGSGNLGTVPRYLLYSGIQSNVRSSSTTIDFVNTPSELQALAQSATNSKIILLGLTFISSTVPIVLGDISSIKYTGHDSEGGMISNGKIATRTQYWSDLPIVEPSSSHVYINVGVFDPIPLPNPDLVGTNQIFEGAQQTIVNGTLQEVVLTGPIYGTDGSYTLKPLETITYQAVGSNLHILSSVQSPFQYNVPYFAGGLILDSTIVPPDTTQLAFTLAGGKGYRGTQYITDGLSVQTIVHEGGFGAAITATYDWVNTDSYAVVLGSDGKDQTGGNNGGGKGGDNQQNYGGGGAGATDVRRNGFTLADRILIAAGGGGGGSRGDGGNGGMPNGLNGEGDGFGEGATQSQGGVGGSPDGEDGSLGQGGNAVNGGSQEFAGGGGGGGLYGGGSASSSGGGAGGGSSFASPDAINPTFLFGGATATALVAFIN